MVLVSTVSSFNSVCMNDAVSALSAVFSNVEVSDINFAAFVARLWRICRLANPLKIGPRPMDSNGLQFLIVHYRSNLVILICTKCHKLIIFHSA